MNNKGQVLVVFILILPLLLLGGAYIVDTTYISYHTNKLNGINSLVIKAAKEKKLDVKEIHEYINKNDLNIKIEIVEITNNKIKIGLKKEIKSLFGNIIGKNKYVLISNKEIEITNNDLPAYQ